MRWGRAVAGLFRRGLLEEMYGEAVKAVFGRFRFDFGGAVEASNDWVRFWMG